MTPEQIEIIEALEGNPKTTADGYVFYSDYSKPLPFCPLQSESGMEAHYEGEDGIVGWHPSGWLGWFDKDDTKDVVPIWGLTKEKAIMLIKAANLRAHAKKKMEGREWVFVAADAEKPIIEWAEGHLKASVCFETVTCEFTVIIKGEQVGLYPSLASAYLAAEPDFQEAKRIMDEARGG